MGLPVTVYRSTDVGAPSVPTKPSEWINVIKKCLVDGYGTKAPLGWALDYEDALNFKAVFRNSVSDGGSGGAVQIQSHSGIDSAGQLVRITCANSITGIDSFFKKVGYRVMVTNSSLSTVKGWIIVGTSRGFWLVQESGQTLNNSSNNGLFVYHEYYFIGDIESFVPNDASTFTLLTTQDPIVDSSSTTYQQNIGSDATVCTCALYDNDGGSGITAYSTDWSGKNDWAYQVASYDPIELGVPINLTKISIYHKNFANVISPAFRGMVPGYYGTNFIGFGGKPLPIIRTFEGNDYLLVTGMKAGSSFIQITGEWYV